MQDHEGESVCPYHVIAKHLFCLGEVRATMSVVVALMEAGIYVEELLDCYVHGRWPKHDSEAVQANQRAIAGGGPVSVIYALRTGEEVCCQTNAERSLTMIALISET
jgi:hypothetical protein